MLENEDVDFLALPIGPRRALLRAVKAAAEQTALPEKAAAHQKAEGADSANLSYTVSGTGGPGGDPVPGYELDDTLDPITLVCAAGFSIPRK